MIDRIRFYLNRLQERLWVRPLLFCLLSVAAAFLARSTDDWGIGRLVPDLTADSITTLLSIMSSSMLVIATFAVGSMVSAYSSASRIATPRSLPLVIADDVSQNALSAFIGAFIFSIIALVAMENGFYEKTGRFTVFVFTLLMFAVVVITFVRWVDKIARLGRMGNTVEKIEAAAVRSLQRRRQAPTMCALHSLEDPGAMTTVQDTEVGYLQRIDLPELQKVASNLNTRIQIEALPGTYLAPGRVLAKVENVEALLSENDIDTIRTAFIIGRDRTFDDDPRFALITLSEIASRALSPAVNDPGTAIEVIGTLLRLFVNWSKPVSAAERSELEFDRIAVPELSTEDLFIDGFGSITRDGAKLAEVMIRLLKAFATLSHCGNEDMREQALRQARLALARAEQEIDYTADLEAVRKAAQFVTEQD